MPSLQDKWIAKIIRGKECQTPLTRSEIENYQLQKIREQVSYAKQNSYFYGELYKDLNPDELCSWSDFYRLPFLTANDISERGPHFLCVRQDEISHVVTMQTSGTTDKPKKIYFTDEDIELTADYFHNGMYEMCTPEDVFLILLPAAMPNSVGDILRVGMERLGAKVIPYGLPDDYDKVLDIIEKQGVSSAVGNPIQLLTLAELGLKQGLKLQLSSVLLSTDYVPQALSKRLNKIWNCKVFEHYGMTEMGLGGGIFCPQLRGYHFRENDLLFEVVDNNGSPLPDGQWGELVFSTLNRRAMPLIRYRTGDMGRFLTAACPCGTPLKTAERVKGRINNTLPFSIAELDEIIFAIDGIVNYQASAHKQKLEFFIESTCSIKNSYTERLIAGINKAIKNNFTVNVKYRQLTPVPALALTKRKILITEE